jgi:hypothetical protein
MISVANLVHNLLMLHKTSFAMLRKIFVYNFHYRFSYYIYTYIFLDIKNIGWIYISLARKSELKKFLMSTAPQIS